MGVGDGEIELVIDGGWTTENEKVFSSKVT
jgi:hypothetical protein